MTCTMKERILLAVFSLSRVWPVQSDVQNAEVDADPDWLSFPTRHGAVSVHRDCVHHYDDHFAIEATKEGGDRIFSGADSKELPRCPYPMRWQNSSAATLQGTRPSYYSDWVAYAETSRKAGYGYMASDWTVPPPPESTGPVPGMSSVYFFNGLEDGGGVHGKATYILQPVLSYGKSGCVVNPLKFFQWHLISFSVTGAGRAYCGKRLSVKEGEKVRGIMSLGSDGKTWSIESIRLATNETSTQQTNLGDKQPDSAYLTLEAMINYSCKAFPANGAITFSRNVLSDRDGNSLGPTWTQVLRHTECNQQVQIHPDSSVTISWGTGVGSSRSSAVII